MATFEGPMMSIKTVNALSHYTDWTVGHVHAGALGWVGLITMGSLYYLVPRLFGKEKMHSVKAIELHFWLATIGIVLYIAAMWIAGVMQGLMWRAVNADGTLTYTSWKASRLPIRSMPFASSVACCIWAAWWSWPGTCG
jgi:cytochrome c oxidase cbb3-type subunit 1